MPDREAIQSILESVVEAILPDDAAIGTIEIGVAGHFDSLLDRASARVVVAAHKTFVADKASRRGDNAELESGHSLSHLKDRPRGIIGHQSAVEERLGDIVSQRVVVFATFGADEEVWVVAWGRDEGQNLASSRFDSHDATTFVGHKSLGVLLEVGIEGSI